MFKKEDLRPGVDLKGIDLSCMDLRYSNLRNADLRYSNLRRADLRYSNLRRADLRGSDLRETILYESDLTRASLSGANLPGSILTGASLSGAILRDANLRLTHLRRANLTGTDLTGANLYAADLSGADLSDTKGLPPMVCPEKGSYAAYKKAEIWEKDHYVPVIVTLEVTEKAKRSSATTNKCRCSEARVLTIESLDGSQKYDKAMSAYTRSFVYEVGKTVKVDDFNNDRWAECTTGIHHFMTREEAEEYLL